MRGYIRINGIYINVKHIVSIDPVSSENDILIHTSDGASYFYSPHDLETLLRMIEDA